ncbi:MAG: HAD-IB family hydrolase [Micromonosporaceae bacterium]|nr:HAD-IB family hydrolase [Micromonosporaceae bacterium]
MWDWLRRRAQVRAARAHLAGVASAEVAAASAAPEVQAALATPPDPSAAAFFDVDNTMLRGASIYWLARGLAARDYFTARDLAHFAWQQLKFRLTSEDAGDMAAARQAALAFIAGRRADEMAELSESVYDELMEKRIWSGTRAMAQMHLDQGQRVWLVTAAPVEVAQLIARRLGLTGALGTVAEVSDGIYTGHLIGDLLHGAAKAEAVKALAEREGLDLERCSAYSDSFNDMPMLTTVGRAVAVNPDGELRRAARRRRWEIRDFRTGRKAAKVAVPTVFGAGAVAGAIFGALALRRRRKTK